MKEKAPVIVLIIVAAGLAVGLVVVNNKARQEKQDLSYALSVQSNTVVTIKTTLAEQEAVNQTLETNLAQTRFDYSNKLTLSDANLRNTQGALEKAQAEAKAQADSDAAELAKRDKKISDLQNQNQDMDKQSVEMRDHIAGLENQIADTKDRLSKSEGDRAVLVKELKRLQAEKVVWEARFNDLAALKAQVKKLREDIALAKNLDWIRRGIYETFNEKGGERLIHPPVSYPAVSNLTVNVELHQNGETKISNPIPSADSPK
jgi:septal ring factor EnvC (AmiA/AmiB activator)